MVSVEAMRSLGSELIQVAFGSPCVACGRDLPVRRRVASCCVDCWSELPRLEQTRCRHCAIPMPGLDPLESQVCLRCKTEPLEVGWIDSWGRYDSGLTKVLHALKFKGHAFIAEPLGDLLAMVLHARGGTSLDVVAPVPMHPVKQRRRGYNQAELLARSLSRRVGIACDTTTLKKTVERETQADLKKEARRANVKDTFAATARAKGLRILLVDDICTTGETLSACAAALMAGGASEVGAITVARTP